jgi:hypothetical protein
MNEERTGSAYDKWNISPIEFEIKDTTDTDRSASYIGLHLEIDSEERLRTNAYVYDFNFPIVNFPFICSNILVAHVYGAEREIRGSG